jgi:glucose-1-phosphate adenylyltransferase
MQDVLSFILGGGRGAGLYPLTRFRSVPAVPVAGKYRLIDIPISNCINSGMQRIWVLTQFLSVSLHRHIANTYKFAPFSRGFVEVLAAQQTNEAADWYQGTADALRQNLRFVQNDPARDVLILNADGLYRMNFAELLATHRETQADVTIAVVPVPRAQAHSYGVVRADETHRITHLVEKPRDDRVLDELRTPAERLARWGLADSQRHYLANMGIYAMKRSVLLDLLAERPAAHDLVTGLIAPALSARRVLAHPFAGYWQDVGNLPAYHEANLALAGANPPFDFHTPQGVIYTRMRHLPASQISAAELTDSLVSDACFIRDGARIERCVIGQRSRISKNVTLRDTVVNGADRLETAADRDRNREQGRPDIGIGAGSVIVKAILDKDCRIGKGVRIVNERGLDHVDGEHYVIRHGIVVIPKGAVVPDGTVI